MTCFKAPDPEEIVGAHPHAVSSEDETSHRSRLARIAALARRVLTPG